MVAYARNQKVTLRTYVLMRSRVECDSVPLILLSCACSEQHSSWRAVLYPSDLLHVLINFKSNLDSGPESLWIWVLHSWVLTVDPDYRSWSWFQIQVLGPSNVPYFRALGYQEGITSRSHQTKQRLQRLGETHEKCQLQFFLIFI